MIESLPDSILFSERRPDLEPKRRPRCHFDYLFHVRLHLLHRSGHCRGRQNRHALMLKRFSANVAEARRVDPDRRILGASK
jgi:hypothetical protein